MEKNLFITQSLDHKIHCDFFEKQALMEGKWVCGIDEAGRGPSAGPVIAAAAIVRLKHDKRTLLNDSKLLSITQRNEAYAWLIKNSWFGIGIANHRLIDKAGIDQANIIAMHRAFAQLHAICPIKPSIILVDAVRLELPIPFTEQPESNNPWGKTIYFPHSEQYSYSIAAASIIAKVTRDRIMTKLATSFPGYNLEIHKGYPTAKHRALVRKHGSAIIHRQSFLRNI